MERSIIVVRIGCWEDQLVVAFLPEDEPTLAEAGLVDGVEFLFEDGTLLLTPLRDGVTLVPVRANSANAAYQREFNLTFGSTEIDVARFCIHETEAVIEDGSLTIELPPPHELPWFLVTGKMGALPNLREICIREFERRMQSAIQAGEVRLYIPYRIKQYIPYETWSAAVSQARGVQP